MDVVDGEVQVVCVYINLGTRPPQSSPGGIGRRAIGNGWEGRGGRGRRGGKKGEVKGEIERGNQETRSRGGGKGM